MILHSQRSLAHSISAILEQQIQRKASAVLHVLVPLSEIQTAHEAHKSLVKALSPANILTTIVDSLSGSSRFAAIFLPEARTWHHAPVDQHLRGRSGIRVPNTLSTSSSTWSKFSALKAAPRPGFQFAFADESVSIPPCSTTLGLLASSTPFLNGQAITAYLNDTIITAGAVGWHIPTSVSISARYASLEAFTPTFEITETLGNILLDLDAGKAMWAVEKYFKTLSKDVEIYAQLGDIMVRVVGGDLGNGSMALETDSIESTTVRFFKTTSAEPTSSPITGNMAFGTQLPDTPFGAMSRGIILNGRISKCPHAIYSTQILDYAAKEI